MAYQRFNRKMISATKAPFVTVQRKGTMAFNASARARLGSPDYIELMYDPDEDRIAFVASTEDEEHAYPLRALKGGNTFLVAGRAFTQFFKINTDVARRYPAHEDGDMIFLDLRGPSTVVTGPRAKKDEVLEPDTDDGGGLGDF